MPTTSNFGWTTPADTDLVKDGAAAIRTLGNGIDTSLLDLKGGTSGQVLSKNSNTDLDYTWVTPNVGDITEVQAGTGISVASGTGPIPVITNTATTTIDAEGDLLVGDAADALQRLAIGSTGNVLTVDTAVDGKIKWAAPAAPAFVGCSVTRSGAGFTVNAATYTAITYDTEQYDTDNIHDNVTNNTRFTVPTGKGGKWVLNVANLWAGIAGGGNLRIGIYKNGTIIRRCQTPYFTANSGEYDSAANEVLDLVATDYIEIYAYQNIVASATCYGATTGTEKQGTAQFYYLGA